MPGSPDYLLPHHPWCTHRSEHGEAPFTQDACAQICRASPLMLLASCVNTLIHCSVFHNLHVVRCSASCVNGTQGSWWWIRQVLGHTRKMLLRWSWQHVESRGAMLKNFPVQTIFRVLMRIRTEFLPDAEIQAVHTGRGALRERARAKKEHIPVNESVHTACKQRQRDLTQITQICLRVLCELGQRFAWSRSCAVSLQLWIFPSVLCVTSPDPPVEDWSSPLVFNNSHSFGFSPAEGNRARQKLLCTEWVFAFEICVEYSASASRLIPKSNTNWKSFEWEILN